MEKKYLRGDQISIFCIMFFTVVAGLALYQEDSSFYNSLVSNTIRIIMYVLAAVMCVSVCHKLKRVNIGFFIPVLYWIYTIFNAYTNPTINLLNTITLILVFLVSFKAEIDILLIYRKWIILISILGIIGYSFYIFHVGFPYEVTHYYSNRIDSIDIPKDAYVLGHIGRFNIVKNHEKIISVFNALHLRRKNSYLLLIGGDSNNRMQIIKSMVQSLGLNEYVRFLNIREDATSIIGCLDGFILPSFSESFSISLVEAEVLHIRCVVSDQVPEDVICNDNCFKMSLDKSDKEWADMLLGNSTQERNNDIEQFDVDAVMLKLVKAYEEIIDDTKNS